MSLPAVGILALQGDVAEHAASLNSIGIEPRFIKLPRDLVGLDGLIIPGGESTTMGKLLRRYEMLSPLQSMARSGFPIWGTCAGMILLADEIEDAGADQPTIGGMDIAVRRNAFGPQGESFETDLDIDGIDGGGFHAIFIRAPVITNTGANVEILSRLTNGTPIAARQGKLLVTSFHPELTSDRRVHQLFLRMVTPDSSDNPQLPQAAATTHNSQLTTHN